MIAKVIQIGNSKGIRIPKPIIEQIGLPDEVELVVENKELIIRPINSPRRGWDEAFKEMAQHQDDRALDSEVDFISNNWDKEEWTW
jgi:antitoxin MazE